MADLFDTVSGLFPGGEEKFAEALLFRSSNGTRSLRIEADSIGLEFTDNPNGIPNVPWGRDPEGVLYYKSLQDFKTATGSTRYTVTRELNPANQRYCLRIKFVDVSTNICYAQFLSYDHLNIVGTTVMNGFSQAGQWSRFNMGYAAATITRNSLGYVVITAKSIGWQATISSGTGIFNSQPFTVEGTLSFLYTNVLSYATSATCNNDRLLFHIPSEILAWFIPHDISPGALGFSQSISSNINDTTLTNCISWVKIS